MDDTGRRTTSDEPERRDGLRFSWMTFALAALLIYELTSHVWLGITFFCMKFGWEYFRTALWLRRSDPDRVRGRTCFWIYAAAGSWRTALAGVALMFAYAMLHADFKKQGPPRGGPPPEFIEAVLVAVGGFLLSAGATLLAMGIARWHGRRIWLDAEADRCRSLESWPPVTVGQNQAGTLILTSMFVFGIPLAGSVFGLVVFLADQFGLLNPTVLMSLSIGGMLLLPIAILLGKDYLERRVLAHHSWEYSGAIPRDSDPIKPAGDY